MSEQLAIKVQSKDGLCEILDSQTNEVIATMTDEEAKFLKDEIRCHNGGPIYDLTMFHLLLGFDFKKAYSLSCKKIEELNHKAIMES